MLFLLDLRNELLTQRWSKLPHIFIKDLLVHLLGNIHHLMKTSFKLHLKYFYEYVGRTLTIGFDLPFYLLVDCSIWHMQLDKFFVINSFLDLIVVEKGYMLLNLALCDSKNALHGFLISINLLTNGT